MIFAAMIDQDYVSYNFDFVIVVLIFTYEHFGINFCILYLESTIFKGDLNPVFDDYRWSVSHKNADTDCFDIVQSQMFVVGNKNFVDA